MGFKTAAIKKPITKMVACRSPFRRHKKSCKETAKRKKTLQRKARRDKNNSQRMDNIRANRLILPRLNKPL